MAGGAAALAGCLGDTGPSNGEARLTARAGTPSSTDTVGLVPLGLASGRDGQMYVPPSLEPATSTPLLLALHGAGGSSRESIDLLMPYADEFGFTLLAVDSRGSTWDGTRGAYGPDVQFIDRALVQTFDRCSIDPARIAIEGFSDGASYSLGLGLVNGDLFHHVIAFSPGFVPASDSDARGNPPVFISHGREDLILSIDATSRRIVPALRAQGYTVDYEEFEGGHRVPPEIAGAAMTWCFG